MILDLLVVLLLAVTLWKIKPVKPIKEFNDSYLSVTTSNAYRGIFALIVIFHHLAQRTTGGYLMPDFTRIGYLAVAVFFFLSGYGLQKKNISDQAYSRGFLIKRIPTILIPYIIMCVLYWGTYALLGDVRTLSSIWNNFIKYGDPIVWFSWYVISIIVFYLAFYLLMKIFKRHHLGTILGGIAYFIVYVFLCKKLSFGSWWYTTALLPVLGIVWATYEKQILKFVRKSYFALLPLLLLAFVALSLYKWTIYWSVWPSAWFELILTIVSSLLFVVTAVLLSLKLKIGNKILDFLGSISFEIYMTQGLSMLLLRNDYIKIANDSIWSVAVILVTVVLSFFLHKLFSFLLKKYNSSIKKIKVQ